MSGDDCIAFLQWALPRLGMRWAGFRKPRGQVCKRIRARMAELGVADLTGYRARLESDPAEWRVLDSLCRVTISRFHRDRGVFDLLRQSVLPELAAGVFGAGRHVVRCWSAGCASGEEPYTLALAWRLELEPRFPDVHFEVVATDADSGLLDRAQAARYSASSLKELPAEWVETAFEPRDSELVLRPGFREPVTFLHQDIRQAMPSASFDLVFCRNLVFTYFQPELQARLLEEILARLRPGGFLVLGAHEALPPGDWPLARVSPGAPVFRRP